MPVRKKKRCYVSTLARSSFLSDIRALTILPHCAYVLVKGFLNVNETRKALWCCLEVVAYFMSEGSIVRGKPVQLVRQCSVQEEEGCKVNASLPLFPKVLTSMRRDAR